MPQPRTTLRLLVLSALLSLAGPSLAQDRELKVHKPESKPSVLKPSASGMQVKDPQPPAGDCKPAADAAVCESRIETAHDLLQAIGRDCATCGAGDMQFQTSASKGVRIRMELPDFCKGVIAAGAKKGYLVTCKKDKP